ncbi:hypothetical protein [Caldiplasma sukawensis]
MSNREVSRILILLGAIISALSGLFLILVAFVSGVGAAFSFSKGFTQAGVVLAAGTIVTVIVGIVIILLSVAMERISKGRGKNIHVRNGIIVLILSVVLFVLGAGFVIGPIISGIGGILLML